MIIMSPTVVLFKFIRLACNTNLRCLRSPSIGNFHFRRVPLEEGLAVMKQNVSLNCFAYLHSPKLEKSKMFPDIENRNIHRFIEELPSYVDVVKGPTVDVLKNVSLEYQSHSSSQESSDIFHRFIVTTLENAKHRQLSLEDSTFHDIVLSLIFEIPNATDDQLLKMLTCLCLWRCQTVRDRYFKRLWNKLDMECSARLKHWEPGFKLLIADYWFHLRLSRVTSYNRLMIENLVQSKDVLSVQQLVQLMFYVNLQRNTPQLLLRSLENKLEHVIKEISLQELCIVCLGFFKTKNRITSKCIIKSIILRMISGVSESNTMAFSGCLKFLRRSMHGDMTELYVSLLKQTVKHLPSMDVPTSIHFILLSATINFYMPEALDLIMNKLVEEKSGVRAKDGMKLLHCMAQFNHPPTPSFNAFFQNLLENEKCEEELTSIPRILFYTLLSYAYLGHYPVNLITKALQPQFVQSCINQNGVEMMSPIAVLNYCVQIECEDYLGPKVDESFLNVLKKERGNVPQRMGRQSFQARLTSLTFQVLSEICHSSHDICIRHVLPHMFSPDIILRLNSKSSVPLSTVIEKISDRCIVKPPADEMWVCVVVLGGYCFSRHSNRLNGVSSMKQRQLRKLGYEVLQVPYYETEAVLQLRKYLEQNLEVLKENHVKTNKRHIL